MSLTLSCSSLPYSKLAKEKSSLVKVLYKNCYFLKHLWRSFFSKKNTPIKLSKKTIIYVWRYSKHASEYIPILAKLANKTHTHTINGVWTCSNSTLNISIPFSPSSPSPDEQLIPYIAISKSKHCVKSSRACLAIINYLFLISVTSFCTCAYKLKNRGIVKRWIETLSYWCGLREKLAINTCSELNSIVNCM